jgi:D-alanyl-D-alanine carboxypeptidase/D-alanyl-D-alanine-endopeptidase (penicillin-binding protein 4)
MSTRDTFHQRNKPLRTAWQIALSCGVISAILQAAPTVAAQQTAMGTSASRPTSAVAGRVAPRALPAATSNKLRVLLANPALRDARIGLCVVALGTTSSAQQFAVRPYAGGNRPTLWAKDAEHRFMPASNLKLYTAALALRQLGAQRTFSTTVVARGAINNGVLDGELRLVGGGDPSLSSDDLRQLAQQVAATGLQRVRGDVVGDGSLFTAESFGGRYPDGWTLDDALWYYGPEVSALAVNRNQVDVFLTGASHSGEAATLRIEPSLELHRFSVLSNVTTGGKELAGKSTEELLRFDRATNGDAISRVLTISGQIAPGQTVTDGFAVADPPGWAAAIFHRALQEQGVTVESGAIQASTAGSRNLAIHQSPPVRILLQRFLKNSDNLYGEMLLRAAARYSDNRPGAGTATRGHQLLFAWLKQNGVDTAALRMTDGSGLSRYNLVTPRATVQLLAAVQRLPGGDAIWNSLPIAGVDGTLGRRMKGTPAQNNVRAKTGTFSIVSTLSGYVTTRDGHRLAVSLLTNFAREGGKARQLQDDVYALLADTQWSR